MRGCRHIRLVVFMGPQGYATPSWYPTKRIEGKWKLSQNRPEADRSGVVAGLSDPEDPDANEAMAALMTERGLR